MFEVLGEVWSGNVWRLCSAATALGGATMEERIALPVMFNKSMSAPYCPVPQPFSPQRRPKRATVVANVQPTLAEQCAGGGSP